MNTTAELADTVRHLLRHPTGGLVGLVDELVALCAGHGLELDWRPDRLRIRLADGEWEEVADELPSKAVVRASLARVAALCNDHRPNSVSPYGGTGLVLTRTNPPAALEATFVNTTAEQRLRLGRVRS